MQEAVPNRNYKDSVFVDLFSEDEKACENFLSLYNALYDTHLNATDELKNIRLDQVLYMTFYNDVSYLVEDKMILLAEHQSTINENMPIRCLEYVVRLYEQLYDAKEKYSRQLLKIPTPEFYVFYNGVEPFPQEYTLKLSDPFLQRVKSPALELCVQVININTEQHHRLLEKCQPMYEYSLFVDTVRRYKAHDPLSGFQKAIADCIEHNILKDYLQRKTKEVINMLLAEYNYDTDIGVQREEAGRIAFAQGMERGIERGIEQGLTQGLTQGSHQAKLETARLMLQHHYPLAEVCLMTGLGKEELESMYN